MCLPKKPRFYQFYGAPNITKFCAEIAAKPRLNDREYFTGLRPSFTSIFLQQRIKRYVKRTQKADLIGVRGFFGK
jgi:hypothetical protein